MGLNAAKKADYTEKWFKRKLGKIKSTKISVEGSSTETVAFQVYEILKTDHEFLQFF